MVTQMEEQVRQTMLRAWRDVMQAKMRETPPDYDWVVRSYVEIKNKLAHLTREGSPIRVTIDEKMDATLFDQMIRNNAFGGGRVRCAYPFHI